MKTMKTNPFKLGLWLLLAGGMSLVSCTKNDKTTIVPVGTEYYIDDIFSVVSDSAFWAAFRPYPEGPIPPKIEGSYVVGPVQRVGSNMPAADWPLQIVDPNIYLDFSEQQNGLVVMEMNETSDHVTDTVFVMGHDLDFTVYCIEDKEIEDFVYQDISYRLKVRRGVVMTGTVDTVMVEGKVNPKGFANFRMATIIMDMESEPEGAPLQPSGSYFIYKDGDGYTERIDL